MDMAIQITEKAAKQIQSQLAKRGRGIGLRIGVKKVGCSGFAYTYDYADEVQSNDERYDAHGTTIVIDRANLPFMQGSTLDFIKEGLTQAFRIDNPNVEATCGCGESVSFKTQ